MKILRGRFDPVLGLSPELTAIIHRCLSQAAARRPSADRLLSMPAVRAKAAELGIELPASVGAAGVPCASPAAGTAARKAPGSPPLRPQLRRATCPDGGPEGGPAMRRVTSTGERREPPLPAAATPSRRQTVQVGAAVPAAGAPGRRQTVQTGAAVPAVHPRPSVLIDSLQAPLRVRLSPPAAPASGRPPRHPSPPRRESYFSVRRVLHPHDGGRIGMADGSAVIEVQRSAKSEGSLPQLLMGGGVAQLHPAEHADGEVVASQQQAAQIRQRFELLLGGNAALFEELHGLARAAVEAESSSSGGCDADGEALPHAARPTMAALSDELFKRTGASAAEALHLLLRLLALEG